MASTSLYLAGLDGLRTAPCRSSISANVPSRAAGLRLSAGASGRLVPISPVSLRRRGASASLDVGPQGRFIAAWSSGDGAVNYSRTIFQILHFVSSRVQTMGEAMRDAVQKPQTQEELQLLTCLKGRMACAAAPVLFAAMSQTVNTPLTVVASGMAKWLELYSGVLMVRVLLSWFPNIPWERQPLQAMRDMCDPYLNLFRNIIPPLFNALDLSPMLAFLVLGVLTSILNTTVQAT